MTNKTTSNTVSISKRDFLKSIAVFLALFMTGGLGGITKLLVNHNSEKNKTPGAGFGSGSYGN